MVEPSWSVNCGPNLIRLIAEVFAQIVSDVSGDVLDSEGDLIFNDLEVGGIRGHADISQGFEESWQDFIRAEEGLKEAKSKVDNINDDIKKAEDIHTQVSNIFLPTSE